MNKSFKVRLSWLKGMYYYTAAGAGILGIVMLILPKFAISILGMPEQDPVSFGIIGSSFLAFGLLSLMGLRSPMKFVPILLLQLTYKTAWFLAVILPLTLSGKLPDYAWLQIIIFATYITGDIIAIPFRYIFAKEGEAS
jgi:hypothetical protein